MTTPPEVLRPCPFCGGLAALPEDYGDVAWNPDRSRVWRGLYIECCICGVSMFRRLEAREQTYTALVAAWNRRHP